MAGGKQLTNRTGAAPWPSAIKNSPARYFGAEDLQTLQTQLYPNAPHTVALERIMTISQVDALELDPHAPSFMAHSRPVRIDTVHGATVGYQVPIPAQSDF